MRGKGKGKGDKEKRKGKGGGDKEAYPHFPHQGRKVKFSGLKINCYCFYFDLYFLIIFLLQNN